MLMKTKQWWIVSVVALLASFCIASAAEMPDVLAKHFKADEPVKAQVIMVVPPKEFEKFVQKLSQAAQKNPEWFEEHAANNTDGSPIPEYHENLGMSSEEYDKYVALWDSREVKKIEDISLMVTESGEGEWKLNGTGAANSLSLIRYIAAENQFKSPNGVLESINDINAPAKSLLGAWTGKEWRYQSENSLTKMKENLALGTSEDGKYGMLIYRLQEVTNSGRPLFDKSLVIRFAAKKN